jgi:valyl-tRNA synthetase
MSTADVWITSRLASTLNDVTQALDTYRITEYAKTMYDFIWRDFCDWYVEIVKVQFAQAVDSDRRWKLMNHTFGVFEDILRMLHPIMPFLTEELWHSIYGTPAAQSIGRSGTLRGRGHEQRAAVEQQFETLQAVVESIRRQRNEMVIPPSERLPVVINVPAELLSLFQEQQPVIASFGRASTLQIGTHEQKPAGSVADVVRGVDIYLVVEGKVDLAKERERLTKERDRLRGQISGIEKKLGNAGFMQGAKPEVVEAEQRKLADFSETIVKIERNLAALA